MYPLYFAKEQIGLIIKEIRGSEKNRQQCVSQGLCPGCEIMLQKNQGENVIVKLHSSYFVVGKELARLIFVQENNTID